MTTTVRGRLETTAIGSLPHHNVDAALGCAFRTSIPFLPQIPIRNPWEYMIPQALEGLPGLLVDRDGAVTLDLNVWKGRTRHLDKRLEQTFAKPEDVTLEPSSATCSSWQPFLWELNERGVRRAKIQLAGPLTCQWVLRLTDGTAAHHNAEIGTQIYRLVMARAISMCRRMRAEGIETLFFLDEPALFALSGSQPRHVLALQELRLLIQAIRKEGAQAGVHCCSDTEWKRLLALDLDVLSLDTGLSLSSLLQNTGELTEFIRRGGRLALGLVSPKETAGETTTPSAIWNLLFSKLRDGWKGDREISDLLLETAILTPSCGLALQTPERTEEIFAVLEGLEDELGSRT